MKRFRSISEARDRARRALPPAVFHYVDGGKEAEQATRENEAAFARILFDVPVCPIQNAPMISTEILGKSAAMPLGIAPTGFVRIIHPDAELGAARAAAAKNIPIAVSSWSSIPIAEIASANRDCWFQLYMINGRDGVEYSIGLAREAGVRVLIVTADIAGIAPTDRLAPPLPDSGLRDLLRFAPTALTRPRWLLSLLREGLAMPAPNAPRRSDGQMLRIRDAGSLLTKTPFSWDDLRWVRNQWDGPLVLKGVMRPGDAVRAAELGVDGVIVSNHGGKVLDSVPATLAVLPRVADALAGRCEIFLDGGVRRGADIVKARALGARAVFIGRPFLWGLAVSGEAGVGQVLSLMERSLSATLANLDCPSIDAVDGDVLFKSS